MYDDVSVNKYIAMYIHIAIRRIAIHYSSHNRDRILEDRDGRTVSLDILCFQEHLLTLNNDRKLLATINILSLTSYSTTVHNYRNF